MKKRGNQIGRKMAAKKEEKKAQKVSKSGCKECPKRLKMKEK